MSHGTSTGITDADLVEGVPQGGEETLFAGEGASAAAMDVQMQTVAYRASLRVTAKVIQPSLIDFLR